MSKQLIDRRQAGFTLVELAVVMIIIGLLIGGVLKGQELIGNAQVTSTVAQVKSIDAATSTFRDMYNSIPGDMANASGRLPNCASIAACTNGDGNNILNSVASAAPGTESSAYFVHLSLADLMTGIDPNGAGGAWGTLFPSAPIRGTGFTVGQVATAANLAALNTGARAGIYLTLTNDPAAVPAASITPNQAARIDAKIDDGVPDSGSVRANGGTCSASSVYTETSGNSDCFLQIRIQG